MAGEEWLNSVGEAAGTRLGNYEEIRRGSVRGKRGRNEEKIREERWEGGGEEGSSKRRGNRNTNRALRTKTESKKIAMVCSWLRCHSRCSLIQSKSIPNMCYFRIAYVELHNKFQIAMLLTNRLFIHVHLHGYLFVVIKQRILTSGVVDWFLASLTPKDAAG